MVYINVKAVRDHIGGHEIDIEFLDGSVIRFTATTKNGPKFEKSVIKEKE